jgi:hypothetical protein
MSAVTNSAVFARKSLAGKAVANKRVATKARAAFNVSANAKVDACDKNSVIVSPSILSANFATLGADVRVCDPLSDPFDVPFETPTRTHDWGARVGECPARRAIGRRPLSENSPAIRIGFPRPTGVSLTPRPPTGQGCR